MNRLILAAALALLLAQGEAGQPGMEPGPLEPGGGLMQEEEPSIVRPPEETRPGAGTQTGRGGTLAPGPEDRTGRGGELGCPPGEERTGRGGQVCRPAGELPGVGRYEEPVERPREFGPQSPTGPEPGDYPRTFPPYGSESGSVPPPYGPGLGDSRGVGPSGR